jgi:hypothetical protein
MYCVFWSLYKERRGVGIAPTETLNTFTKQACISAHETIQSLLLASCLFFI